MQRKFNEPIKLNLGSAGVKIPGFLSVDAVYQPGVDIVEDIRFLRSFEENSVSLLYASAVCEHLSRWENKSVFQRWFNILKPGGEVRISVPGWEEVVKHYQRHHDLRILIGFLYGGQDNMWKTNEHHYIWDFKTMKEDLEFVGFRNIEKYDWRETEVGKYNIDDYSQSYLPHLQKDTGTLMHLNVRGYKD